MEKTWEVVVVAKEEKTAQSIVAQLERLLGEYITFIPFSLKGWLHTEKKAELVIVSTHILAYHTAQRARKETDIIILRRTLLNKSWKKILDIPLWKQIMLVNDERDSAAETISLLYELGARHIELIPFYPGLDEIPQLDTAITPGEVQLVPPHVKKIIDIGDRVVDLSTLVDLLTRFNLFNQKTMSTVVEYAQSIIPRSQGLQAAMRGLMNLKDLFKESLNRVEDGIITYDENGHITVFNQAAEDIFSCNATQIMGQEIHSFLKKKGLALSLPKEDIKERLVTIGQQDIILSRESIESSREYAGGVLTLQIATKVKELERRLRRQIKAKGHQAQYSFSHLIYKSKTMERTLEIAKKIADNDLNILIQGETGTGKEIFAQAIHNASPRKNDPFVAINCSALPDTLLESELFGFEEGAFTGARKGGKPGLFEQAHQGTIFLDEIGDISSNLQVRLLRVVQQKEILKIGGTYVLPIDVRILAATNCDLSEMAKNGQFRADLYHRLNVLHLRVPSLRERREDIPLLIQHFLKERDYRGELTPEITDILQDYHWPGNVRELENTISYLMVMGSDAIQPDDIPSLSNHKQEKETSKHPLHPENSTKPWECFHGDRDLFLLELIYQARSRGETVGRRSLARLVERRGFSLSETRAQRHMKRLEKKGLLSIRRGRAGCHLTEKGFNVLKRERA